MFNLSGSELIFLLLLALIVLGPEKLPDAVRKFGKTYAEVRKMTTGFQSELKQALDEPMREMRGTADAIRKAAKFDGVDNIVDSAKAAMRGDDQPVQPIDTATPAVAQPVVPIVREPGINFGSANPRPADVDNDETSAT